MAAFSAYLFPLPRTELNTAVMEVGPEWSAFTFQAVEIGLAAEGGGGVPVVKVWNGSEWVQAPES